MDPKEKESKKPQRIKLEDEAYCEGCPFLFFDEKKSTPSQYIGEGYYVHFCNLFEKDLSHYLHHPLRLKQCIETQMKGAEVHS